jgi:hypothetical protein
MFRLFVFPGGMRNMYWPDRMNFTPNKRENPFQETLC